MNELNQKITFNRILVFVLCFLVAFSMISTAASTAIQMQDSDLPFAYCTDNEYADQASSEITTVLKDTGDHINVVFLVLVLISAGIAIVVAAAMMIFGGQRGMHRGFIVIGCVFVAVAIAFLAPLLVKAFAKWFVGNKSPMSSVTDILG